MKIDARVTYGALCKRLGVYEIPGVAAVANSPEPAQVILTLHGVTVNDEEARECLIEKEMWKDDPELADDPGALRDFVDALLAGDISLARIAGDRLFENECMRLACEAALVAPAVRRAA